MKTYTCMFLLVLCVSSFALETKIEDTIQNLMQMEKSATGATGVVMNLLHDLVKANVAEQFRLNKRCAWQKKVGEALIVKLTGIRNAMAVAFANARAHLRWLRNEWTDTVTYIQWIDNRKATMAAELKNLADQRCYSNSLFVKNLKEHRDALRIIKLLIKDLKGYVNPTLAQLSDVSNKLNAYSHLFNKQAYDKFLQLGREHWVDNTRGQIKVRKFKSGTKGRNLHKGLGAKVVDLLHKLAAHLRLSMRNHERAEIQAAYDFADYQTHSEREMRILSRNRRRKVRYQRKLKIDMEVGRAARRQAKKNLKTAQRILNHQIRHLRRQMTWCAHENLRINKENAILKSVIAIFQKQVHGVAAYLKKRIASFHKTGKFRAASLKHKHINRFRKHKGKFAAHVAAAAGPVL